MPTLTKLFGMKEVSEHNSKDDCWIIIDGKVYDVSTYLDDHPGGEDVILETTGKDATDDFEDAGHSKDARKQMEEFCIGELDTSAIDDMPELQIVSKKKPAQDFLGLAKQYWVVPISIAAISVIVGVLYFQKK